jgi:hypothetical protein
LVVTDESHYLSSSETGDTTLALDALRALTWHPQGLHRRVQMLDPEAHDGLRTLRMYERFKRLTPDAGKAAGEIYCPAGRDRKERSGKS